MFLEEISSIEKHYRFYNYKWGFKTSMYWDKEKRKERFPQYVNPLRVLASWFHPNLGSPESELIKIYWTTKDFCNCPDRRYRKKTCKHMTSIQNKLEATNILTKFLKVQDIVQTIHDFVGKY